MAAHDFASQKKPSKSKGKTAKPSPKAKTTKQQKVETPPKPKKKVPAIVWIIIGISIAYGGQQLYQYAKTIPTVDKAISQANKAIAETSEKIIEPISSPKEEAPRFEFYELLKNNKVEISSEKTTIKPTKKFSYVVQAGSFRNQSDAEQMRSQLILNNLTNTTTDKITTSNGVWHRVNVGPFTNRSKLEKARDKLASMNIQGLVRKKPMN